MRFEKYLGTDVLGCYRPGTVISVRAGTDAGRITATKIHECTHLAVTSASTLGVVGILCGLPMVYRRNSKESAAAEKYVGSLCTLSFWVQEGAATANEIAWDILVPLVEQVGSTFELVVEPGPTYTAAAYDILDVAFPIATSIDKEHLGYTVQSRLLALLFYAYCRGIFSSRKIMQACEERLTFRVIAGDDIPNFRTISDHTVAQFIVQNYC